MKDDLNSGMIVYSASFVDRNKYAWTLILRDLSTGNERFIADYNNGNKAVAPQWLADGRRLLYSFNENCEGIFIYDVVDDRLTRIDLSDDESGDCQATWSSDGRHITYQSDRNFDPSSYYNLFILDTATAQRRQLTRQSGGFPTWSPGDEWIVYYSPLRNAGLFRIKPDGSQDHEFFALDDLRLRTRGVTWSPDGKQITFSAWFWDKNTPDFGHHLAYVADADGRNARRLTQNTWAYCTPVWSPDGSRIALLANATETYGSSAIYLIEDGHISKIVEQTYSTGDLWNLWSPSGRYIAYASLNDDKLEGRGIHIMDVKTGDVESFATGLPVAYPVWRPNVAVDG